MVNEFYIATITECLSHGERPVVIAQRLGLSTGRVRQLISILRLEGHVLKHPQVYALEQKHRRAESILQSKLDIRARQRAHKRAQEALIERRPRGRPRKTL